MQSLRSRVGLIIDIRSHSTARELKRRVEKNCCLMTGLRFAPTNAGVTMASKHSSANQSANGARSDAGVSYNEFKDYEGQRYTGMKIGRSHKWFYDQGEWKETKITPDLWQVSYAVTKRRAGHVPEGSGVPVGTEYHWYVLAHQNAAKQSANHYTTSLTGLKFKIAHKRAGSETWSATPKTQRKRMIMFLQNVIADLGKQNESEGDVISTEKSPAASERRQIRARRSEVKRATPVSRRTKRPSARRRAQRTPRVGRAQHSKL